VLELGCGWGSLCLYLAERYPASEITAVSNSKTQKQLIMQRAKDRKLTNLKVCCLPLKACALVHHGYSCMRERLPACIQMRRTVCQIKTVNGHGCHWQVITADVVDFDAPAAVFDRVMSIEMFEHMKNYKVSRVK
jgi:cyclopropane-fatty-acyl-phospholipid synthase